jgi:protein-S-isoprenylcysteine O-methyltransferase
MHTAIFIWLIYALWILLFVYLTITAIYVKQAYHENLGQRFGIMFAIIAAFLLPYAPVFQILHFTPTPLTGSTGLILCAAGMILLVWGRAALGMNWSPTVVVKKGQELVTTGPYRFIRNPMYVGGLLAAIGSAIVAGGVFIFLHLFLTPLFPWRIGAEDKLMGKEFPKDYPHYKKRTKALIPLIW